MSASRRTPAPTISLATAKTPVNPAQIRKLRQAKNAAKKLVAAGAESVALFGSVARGDANADSDIDLLAVATEPLPLKGLTLPESSAPAFTTWQQMSAPGAQQYAFLTVVASEAVMLHDPEGKLATAFTKIAAPEAEKIAADYAGVLRRLSHYDHLERFGGLYLHLLADSYRFAKGSIITASAHAGEPQARREDAWAWFAKRHPERARDIKTVCSVEPHYSLTMDKGEFDDLPFSYRDCDDVAKRVLAAAKRIVVTASTDAAAL